MLGPRVAWSLGERIALKDHLVHEFNYVQAFDAMIHFSFEGSFLWLSVFGRQVNTSTGPFAEMCECAVLLPYVCSRRFEI